MVKSGAPPPAPAPGWRHSGASTRVRHGGATASTSARMAALHHRQHQRQGGGINIPSHFSIFLLFPFSVTKFIMSAERSCGKNKLGNGPWGQARTHTFLPKGGTTFRVCDASPTLNPSPRSMLESRTYFLVSACFERGAGFSMVEPKRNRKVVPPFGKNLLKRVG